MNAAERELTARRPSILRRAGFRGAPGAGVLALMMLACIATLPYTIARAPAPGIGPAPGPGMVSDATGAAPRRFEAQNLDEALLPPFWAHHAADERDATHDRSAERLGTQGRDHVASSGRHWLGTDRLGRDLLVRCLAGGGISLCIGLAASFISVVIGTTWGTIAGYHGGRVDALLMRIVDILYGLPYILLVVLLAVAADGLIDRRGSDLSSSQRQAINIVTLLVAIGSVSWLTMARIIRGQVLSLRQQPFVEAARAIGVGPLGLFIRHLLPNLLGPIIVYATLTVPTAILSESFLSFLGIGVREPLPSWGNLAADGLSELNTVRVRWWLLLWPCLFIATTLLSLNFMGEALREAVDPRRRAKA